MRAKVIKLKIMSKNKRHNDLKMKCNKIRTTHSQDRYKIERLKKLDDTKLIDVVKNYRQHGYDWKIQSNRPPNSNLN